MDVSGSSGNDIIGFKQGDNLTLKFGEATFTARPNKPTAGKFQTIRYIEKGSEKEYYISSKTFDRLGLAAGKESKVTLYARESKKLGKSQMKVSLTPPSVRHRTTESTNDVSKKIFAPSQKQIDAKALKKQEVGQLTQTHDKLTEELNGLTTENIPQALEARKNAESELSQIRKAKSSKEFKQARKDLKKLTKEIRTAEKTKEEQDQLIALGEALDSFKEFDGNFLSSASLEKARIAISNAEETLQKVPRAKKSNTYKEVKRGLVELKAKLKSAEAEDKRASKNAAKSKKNAPNQPIQKFQTDMIRSKREGLSQTNLQDTKIFVGRARTSLKGAKKQVKEAAKIELKYLQTAISELEANSEGLEAGSSKTDVFQFMKEEEFPTTSPTARERDAYLKGDELSLTARTDAERNAEGYSYNQDDFKYTKEDFDIVHSKFNTLPQERKQKLIDLGWGFLAAPPHSGKEN